MSRSTKLHEQHKDQFGEMFITGRHQEVPRHPHREFKKTTLAAGAVLWRGDLEHPDSIEVACIHRPHYDDWSLAKGKVDPGEFLVTTAVREIQEETGYEVRLGKLIGKTVYPVKNTTKVVYYWTGKVVGGEFTPNNEVDEIRWLNIDDATQLMSYELDRQVLLKAAKRFATPADTRILYVRHARANYKEAWKHDDSRRPLDKKGKRQAKALVPLLQAFAPESLYSAEPLRCEQTLIPLAKALGKDITIDATFGEIAWQENQVAARADFDALIKRGGTHVVCSQGGVIPEMIAALSADGRLPIDSPILAKKASVWVLSFNDGQLIGADYMPSPLPVL
ncbi:MULTISPECIES: NUDIX hydrolase [Corynebacterium]|uniref:NUDIX hydrolase n=1 Tax=Corynebacterium TaxID=1716 RepID=UPI0008FB717A|nr:MULTISPECIES: NUDIX hydrolase [Corynebacterium]MCQ4610123.1 NUDIX hydrolase [Corynebacterium sp. CCUG 61414]MCQ4616969.1 NUDIX hydrolase [Corynebacterium pseudogenitalium]MDK8364197.1 NUDIX hydrolase [Corynebacterium sp. UMB10119B]OIR40493.1 NTP pyrophosphohydrolase [Corynebacterium sp. NML120713]WPJ92839.1 NUDIX hydrolase [Corynebacterium sp. UMB2355A]